MVVVELDDVEVVTVVVLVVHESHRTGQSDRRESSWLHSANSRNLHIFGSPFPLQVTVVVVVLKVRVVLEAVVRDDVVVVYVYVGDSHELQSTGQPRR